MFRVHQEQWQAIGGSHRQQDTGLMGQQRIANRSHHARLFPLFTPAAAVLEFAGGCALSLVDHGGMDLPKRRQRKMFYPKLPEEELPIFPHPRARLAFCESEVEPRRGTAAHPTPAGTEGMDQPGITGHERVLNPAQPATRDDL
jgi:hypothetical protein